MKRLSPFYKKPTKSLALVLVTMTLCGCSVKDRLADIGRTPDLTPIENPTTKSNYRAVSMPMPNPKVTVTQRNSLWSSDRQTFFEDQRADQIGDILTVVLDIKDKAEMDSSSQRSRKGSEGAGLDKFLGYEASLAQVLPETVENANLIGTESDSSYKGSGAVDREEKIQMKLAAIVTQLLPNGNMVIQGRQEIRVNFEKRILEIAGVIRPQDITTDNTIPYEKIAEARISYGGKGQITDVQQPRYGQQVYDVLFPF